MQILTLTLVIPAHDEEPLTHMIINKVKDVKKTQRKYGFEAIVN